MGTLAKTPANAAGQADARLAELVSQLLCRRQRLPALLAIAVEQVDLRRLRGERRSLHSQQPHLCPFLPIVAKQSSRICSKISLSSCVGAGKEWARVMVVKSL